MIYRECHIPTQSLDLPLGNLKTESNKDEKEIERIKVVEMDIDSKSKNEYKN